MTSNSRSQLWPMAVVAMPTCAIAGKLMVVADRLVRRKLRLDDGVELRVAGRDLRERRVAFEVDGHRRRGTTRRCATSASA